MSRSVASTRVSAQLRSASRPKRRISSTKRSSAASASFNSPPSPSTASTIDETRFRSSGCARKAAVSASSLNSKPSIRILLLNQSKPTPHRFESHPSEPFGLTSGPVRLFCPANAPAAHAGFSVSGAIRRRYFRDRYDGQGRLAQDQAALDCRHGLFLRHQKERPHQDGKARLQEIRSRRAQARRVQGNEDQVRPSFARPPRGRLRAPF